MQTLVDGRFPALEDMILPGDELYLVPPCINDQAISFTVDEVYRGVIIGRMDGDGEQCSATADLVGEEIFFTREEVDVIMYLKRRAWKNMGAYNENLC